MKPTHLEYSFGMATCNLSEASRSVVNPFTGKPIEIAQHAGLTDQECAALLKLVKASGWRYSDIPGEGWEWKLSASEALRLRGEIESGSPGWGVELVVKELAEPVLEFLLSLARAGNLAFTSSTGQDVRLAARSTNPLVQKRWPNAPILASAQELREWLDQVIGSRRVAVL